MYRQPKTVGSFSGYGSHPLEKWESGQSHLRMKRTRLVNTHHVPQWHPWVRWCQKGDPEVSRRSYGQSSQTCFQGRGSPLNHMPLTRLECPSRRLAVCKGDRGREASKVCCQYPIRQL